MKERFVPCDDMNDHVTKHARGYEGLHGEHEYGVRNIDEKNI